MPAATARSGAVVTAAQCAPSPDAGQPASVSQRCAEAIKVKSNFVQWWTGENEAQAGFLVNGGTIGLCWDSTGYNLKKEGNYGYVPPKEGAFAWNQGFVLMSSRCSFELVQKCAIAGVGALATVSAPTALALSLARQAHLKLAALSSRGVMIFDRD